MQYLVTGLEFRLTSEICSPPEARPKRIQPCALFFSWDSRDRDEGQKWKERESVTETDRILAVKHDKHW